MTDHTQLPWTWHLRFEGNDINGSVYSEVRPGHAYAVAMMPRYQTQDRWQGDAELIVKAVNSHELLIKALEEIVVVDDTSSADEAASRMFGIASDTLAKFRKNQKAVVL